jgi:hypothetical protein
MTAKNAELQRVWRQYELAHGHVPSTAREACEWGVRQGLTELPVVDPYDILAEDMARALREEYRTDEKGRRYRVNHAVRVTKGGVQHTFWAIMGFAPPEHMRKAFTQRREQIVGDCLQLKTDVDVYNDLNPDAELIQLILDFTDDVAEREHWKGLEEDDEAA